MAYSRKKLTVELAVLDIQRQRHKANQAPDALIQEGGMHRHAGVHRHAGRQRDLHRLQVGLGALAVHAPGQRGVGAEGILVHKVAPAADAWPMRKPSATRSNSGSSGTLRHLAARPPKTKAPITAP